MIPQTIGIVGMGLLGRGIASCFLGRGFRVVVQSLGDDWREPTRRDIATAIDDLIEHGCIDAKLRKTWQENYREADFIAAMSDCEFMIESVAEDLAAKRSVLKQIESAVSADVPIATNTSTMPITLLQQGRRHPERLIGMHWAPPCHVTRFLEVIRGDQTNEATVQTSLELAQAAGKEPSLVKKDVAGFIVNRLGYAMFREAFAMLEAEVADVETIDRVFRQVIGSYASIAGPFRWMDLTGLAAYVEGTRQLFPKLDNSSEVPAALRALVEDGAKGIANGRGFYSYTPEQVREWQQRLLENVWRTGGASCD